MITEQEKDALLYQLTERLDETEKITRKYLNACVHPVADRLILDANRVLIDGIKASLRKAST